MKTYSKGLLILFFSVFLMGKGNAQITSITTINNGFIIDFTLPIYEVKDTNIFEVYGIDQDYSYIDILNFGEMANVGYPNLPQYTIDLHIPDNATAFSVSTSNKVSHIDNLSSEILPAQDDFEEDTLGFIIQSNFYGSNGSLFAFNNQISDTFNIMGAHGISFSIFPFQYNPLLNTLEVITSCRFTITHNGSSSVQLKSTAINNTTSNLYLSQIFENYPILKSGSVIKGRYLIITDPSFEDAILYFANFKRNIGYDVTVVNTSITGTTSENIKSYIQNQYDNSQTRPTYVLLVGGHDLIPASGGSTCSCQDEQLKREDYTHPLTDLDYTRLSGNNFWGNEDYYPDVFLGRFSVSTVTALQNIINKTIYMEMNLKSIDKKVVLFSSSGDGEKRFDKSQQWVIDHVLEPQGYNYDKFSAFEGASYEDGVNALSGDYTLFLMRGHGDYERGLPPFSFSDYLLNRSTNTIYPFVFFFGCKTNNFGYDFNECLGEHWISDLHGGVSYFGATTITYSHANTVIEEKILSRIDDHDQLSAIINLGMKDFYKRFWAWLSIERRNRHMRSYNLLGDPSIYFSGIDCQENIYFTNNEVYNDGESIRYHAVNEIVTCEDNSTFVALDGSTVYLNAGNSITMKPGFSARSGSTFSASIAPCVETILKSAKIKPTGETANYFSRANNYNESENDSLAKDNVLICYPNPVKNSITFCFKKNTEQVYSVSIYNYKGDKVLVFPQANISFYDGWYKIEVDVSSLSDGSYFYTINYKEGYEKGRFIKVK